MTSPKEGWLAVFFTISGIDCVKQQQQRVLQTVSSRPVKLTSYRNVRNTWPWLHKIIVINLWSFSPVKYLTTSRSVVGEASWPVVFCDELSFYRFEFYWLIKKITICKKRPIHRETVNSLYNFFLLLKFRFRCSALNKFDYLTANVFIKQRGFHDLMNYFYSQVVWTGRLSERIEPYLGVCLPKFGGKVKRNLKFYFANRFFFSKRWNLTQSIFKVGWQFINPFLRLSSNDPVRMWMFGMNWVGAYSFRLSHLEFCVYRIR